MMKSKLILVSALFVSIFTNNIIFAEEENISTETSFAENITEEISLEEIAPEEVFETETIITELDLVRPTIIDDPVLSQVLNLDVLLQAFMAQNKDFLNQQKNRLLKSLTKEGSTIIPLATLLACYLGGPTISYIKNWYGGTPSSFKDSFNTWYKEQQIAGLVIPSIASITAYVIIRLLYFGQKKITKKVNVNLQILTQVILEWPDNKDKVAIKLHALLDQIHDQYLQDKKINLTEIQAQEIVRKLIDMGFKQLEEYIETKGQLINNALPEVASFSS